MPNTSAIVQKKHRVCGQASGGSCYGANRQVVLRDVFVKLMDEANAQVRLYLCGRDFCFLCGRNLV